jgi:hypothetical protein
MTSEREPIVGNENRKLFLEFERSISIGRKIQVPQIIKTMFIMHIDYMEVINILPNMMV